VTRPTNAITVRLARVEEAPLLSSIARAAKARWKYPAAWVAAWASELAFSEQTFERMTVVVAEDAAVDGLVLGVAALERRAAGWSLEHFWVDPTAEGRGVGRALFTHVVDIVRDSGGGTISITSDPNAAGFYERMGARAVGIERASMPGAPTRELPRFEYDVALPDVGSSAGREPTF
jgi:GNAT superfamily N-acetyltransferase